VPVFPPTPNVRLMLPRSRLVFSRTVQLLASLFRRCNSTWIIHQYVTDAKCILLSFLGAEKLIRGVAWVDCPKKNEGSRKSLAPWKRKIECNLKRKRFAKPEIAIQNKKKCLIIVELDGTPVLVHLFCKDGDVDLFWRLVVIDTAFYLCLYLRKR